jgi:membrane-bound serine protease (ClpP class)
VPALFLLFADPAAAEIPVVELVGTVQPVSAQHVVSAIDQADREGAPLLILRIDTPGGLDTSMRQIIDKMLNCQTPIAAFVGPSGARAASAGFLITIVADVAAMAPGTNMGAAHPVSGMGGEMDKVMAEKVTQDAAAYIRGKAEKRGRNAEMAEKAVVDSLSFTDQEALKEKLIDLVVPDVPALIEALDGREVKRFDGTTVTLDLKGQLPRVVAMSWRQQVLSAIASPEVLFLLLLGALAGLGTEISHPGMIFPGVIGVLCLILFLFATQYLPVSGAGVLLILVGVGLLIAEVKVTSYGLLTVGGIVFMMLGGMMLIDSPVPAMRLSFGTLIPGVVAMTVWALLLVNLVVRSQRRRATTGYDGMIGQRGIAETSLDPEGWVLVAGERWRAVADPAVPAGEPVTVLSVDGLRLRVQKGV